MTTIQGGVATNVVPDRATAHVNFRYAPTHTPAEAERRLRELLGHPSADGRDRGQRPARPGALPGTRWWSGFGPPAISPSARSRPGRRWRSSASSGVDAVNFGPGDPQYAHRDDEQVDVAALVRSYEVLRAFLEGTPGNARDRGRERWSICRRVFEPRSRIRSRSWIAARRPRSPRGDRSSTSAWATHGRRRRRSSARPLKDAIEPTSSYPRAAGLPELRGAIASWVERRFGTVLDPDVHILPTLGSKEPIFSLAQSLLDPEGGKHLVTVTSPGYTIPERGARFAGGDVARLSLTEANGLPARPPRRGRLDLGPHRRPVAELPEQPDGRDRAARRS